MTLSCLVLLSAGFSAESAHAARSDIDTTVANMAACIFKIKLKNIEHKYIELIH